MEREYFNPYLYSDTLLDEILPNMLCEHGVYTVLQMIEYVVETCPDLEHYAQDELFRYCEDKVFESYGFKRIDG